MTEAERQAKQAELDRLLKEEELARLEAEEADANPPESLVGKAFGLAKKAGSTYLDAMAAPQKYAVSTPLAAGMSKLSGKTVQQLMGKEGGNTPSRVLKEAGYGIPRGNPLLPPGTPYIPGTLSGVTAGDVGDLALDAVSDPMLYVGAGVNALARRKGAGAIAKTANALVNPIEAWNEGRASSLYGKAFEDVDRVSKLNNKPIMASELMRDAGFVGGPEAAERKLIDIRQQAGRNLGDIRTRADAKGVTGNLWSQVKPEAEREAAELRQLKNSAYHKMADKIDQEMNYALGQVSPESEVPFSTLGAEKSGYDSRVTRAGGHGLGYEAADTTQVNEAMSNAYRRAEEHTLKKHAPDMFPEFDRQKQLYSSAAPLLSDKAETVAARVANRRGMFEPTAVEAMVGGHALASGDPATIGALVTKKGLNLYTKPVSRTARGYVADKIAKTGRFGVLDEVVRQMASPWTFGSSSNSEEEQ